MTYQPFVYGLRDSVEAGNVRYVGMAPSNPSRPYQHAMRARKDLADGSHLMHWIRKIQAEGREPSVIVLEELPVGTSRRFLGFVESCYIKSLRSIGHQLTNENDGGWGGSNGPHSEAAKVRMRAGWTPEIRARVGVASRERNTGKKYQYNGRTTKGRPLSFENRIGIGVGRKQAWDNATAEERALHAAKISAAKIGQPSHSQTEETRLKISKALTGRAMSDEWRAKNAAAQTGKKQSDDTKAKRSAALKLSWALRKANKEAIHG